MNIYSDMAEKIIEKQESIIGPLAIEQAQKVKGLEINWPKHEIHIIGNETEVVEHLVEQYQHLFGRASIEACKEAVSSIITQLSPNQIPALLR